jgi:hypothetical protein
MTELVIFPVITYAANPAAADMFNFGFSCCIWFGFIAFAFGLIVRILQYS